MNRRSRGYWSGLALGALMLALVAASGLCAQEGEPPAVPRNETKSPESAGDPADAKRDPSAPGDTAPGDAGPDKAPASGSILDLDIEQLGKVQAKVPTAFDETVTSVTSNKSTIGKSAAAVFVITNEMIRRSGATSIPETLRMSPGLQVAKIGSSKWAITARGFNGQFADELLVLVDGRSVYSQFNAGVFWETQDLVLQDVERIEVVRGPGATVWGANAVNGVINIITKTSKNTQGTQVSAGGGDQDQSINAVRFGGKIGDNATYRVYAKNTDRAAGFSPTNPTSANGANDDWQTVRGGFRLDWNDPDQQDQLTLQGDMYAGAFGEQANLPQPTFPFFGNVVQEGHFGGTNVLGRWTRNVEENNTYSLQAYFDRSQRLDTEFNFTIDTYDVEFRQNLKHSDNHVFTWGTGYRLINDDIQPSQFLSGINPPLRTWDQATAFLQEEMPFVRDDLRLTVGSKFMYYFFTGFEYQPTARLLWEIDDQQVAWGAVSRAVRTPSRLEEDAAFAITAAPAPVLIGLQGGGGSLVSEELLAYELGYRKQVTEKLSFELATFYNVYRNLIESVPVGLTPGPPPIMATQFRNSASAQSYGIELNAQWELRDWWRLRGWYSFMRLHLDATGTSDDPGDTPINQAYLMSSWDLPKHVEFDLMPRVVENLPFLGVPGYATLDARLGWRPGQNWEFSIIGQNLLAPHHLEYVGQTTIPSEVNRGVFAQVVWRH